MDLFAHQLIDSIEIVGDPLRERACSYLLCFFHISYNVFFYDKYKDQDEQNKSAE